MPSARSGRALHFTRLKLTGFKSFVDPTEFLIEPGVTGVVGPNGCGKSNLVEALRWAMGESSARSVRGGEMDDVIFAGTARRPAHNAAEVSLSLDDCEDLPAAWRGENGEIEIARRILRGGGSLYRINGREARARDVQLLFADAASGARSAALVSQGQIGVLIGAKPLERRHLLEEAAGVTGLHGRRREAELRLRAAEANLERLEDVIAGDEARLQGLERQARQARRYRRLGDRLRRADAALLHRRRVLAEAALTGAAEGLAAAERTVAENTRAAARAAAEQAEAAAAMPALRAAEAAAVAALHRQEVARETLRAESRRAAEETEAGRTQLEHVDADSTRESQLAAEAEAAAARLDEEARRFRGERTDERDRRERAERALTAGRRHVERVEAMLAAATEAQAMTGARRDALVRRLAALDERIATLDRRAASAAGEGARLQAQLDDDRSGCAAEAALAAARDRAAICTADLESRRAAANDAAGRRETAESKEREAREALREAAVAHERTAAEHGALAALLAVDDRQPLLDRMVVPDDLVLAVAAALGDDLLAGDDVRDAAHWRERAAPPCGPALPEGAVPLSGLIEAPALLQARLEQVGVVVRAHGAALQAVLRQGQRLVSREGDLWRWDGFTASAEAEGGAAKRLAQRRRLARLAADSAALAKRREAAEARLARTAAALESAAARLDRARSAEAEAARRTAAAARELDSARERRDAAAAALAAARARLAAVAETAAGIRRDRREALAEHGESARALAALPADDALRAPATAARHARQTARNDLDILVRRHETLTRAEAVRTARLAAVAAETADWRRRLAAAAERRRALDDRRAVLAARLRELQARPAKLQERAAALDDEIAAAGARRRRATDMLAAAETRLAEAHRVLTGANDALARSREERVRAEGGRNHARAAVDDAAARIVETFDCEPEDLQRIAGITEDDREVDVERLEREAARLRRERENMGAVNLRAAIDAAELDERIVGMKNERDDLLKALAKLRGAIESLNREGRARLAAAFEAVNEHFRAVFERLFGGGRAYLRLVGADDPLEAGLEIMASPPGKRLQTLSLLSGGEKALAALALLFALFRTRPAPICVLDEVDAPLDDANVARFCDLLDDTAREGRTRFLVVTHHRLTMARMSRLYGVTMGERGVSQLVSVDIGEAAQLQAAE